MVTQKDVADLAGVSFITVSRVINEKGNVKEETRQRVLDAIKELNYYPNALGQGLTANRVNTVGVVTPIPSGVSIEETSYYRRLLTGVELYCVDVGFDILLSAERGIEDDYDFLKAYHQRKADGLILMGLSSSNIHFSRIKEEQVPCVVIGDRAADGGASSINSDNVWGTKQAVEFLIKNGHRRIAYLHVERWTQDTAERLESFRSVMKEYNLPFPDQYLLLGDFRKQSGVAAVRAIASMRDRPTALVCCTDLMALGVMEGSRSVGLRIPDDLSVVGFDGHEITEYTNPPLATVVQDLEGMGKKAAELVIKRIQGENDDCEDIVFPVVFEPRASVKSIE